MTFRIGQKVRDRRTGYCYLYCGPGGEGVCWVKSAYGLCEIGRKYLCVASGPNRIKVKRQPPKVTVTKTPGNRDWLLKAWA